MSSGPECKMDRAIREAQSLTPKQRALKIQEKKSSGRAEDKEYVALLYASWEGVAIAVPDHLRCTNCKGKRECCRPTVAGSLETIDVKGEKVYLRGLMWVCLACLRRSQPCHVAFKDEEGRETTLTYQGLTKSQPAFPVQGFMLNGKPRRDAPEHNVPFVGKSKADAFDYINKLREAITNEALDAVPRDRAENPRTNVERARFIREARDTLRKMEDQLDDLSFKVHDYLDVIKKHRTDDAFDTLCRTARTKLFEGLIKFCRTHDDVTYCDTTQGSGERLVLLRVHEESEQYAIDGAVKGMEEGHKREFPSDESDEVMAAE